MRYEKKRCITLNTQARIHITVRNMRLERKTLIHKEAKNIELTKHVPACGAATETCVLGFCFPIENIHLLCKSKFY